MLIFDGIKTLNPSRLILIDLTLYVLEGQYMFEYLSTEYAYYNFH